MEWNYGKVDFLSFYATSEETNSIYNNTSTIRTQIAGSE